MFYPLYFDNYYFWLIIIPLLLGIWAQTKVTSTFNKYQKQTTTLGFTGAQVARKMLDDNGLVNVAIEPVRGSLTDHYDPKAKVVRLSENVYHDRSISAIGVAAHECGHAIQDSQDYAPMRIRSAIIPITNIGSQMAVPLILVGLIFNFQPLTLIGVFGYAMIAIFQLVTLPVEFNASSRAIRTIETMGATDDEQKRIRSVLRAAALTYVAALISAVTQFLHLCLRYGRRNDR